MAKSKLLHPQFFHKLVPGPPGFNSHLTIPIEFFSKYVEEKITETKNTAELKSDSSDKIWQVKITGRILTDGWEDFAVANGLRIGDVVLVSYKGDLVFHVSGSGSKLCEITDMQPPNNNIDHGNDQDEIGKSLLIKHPRTEVSDDDEDLPIEKIVKTNSNGTEADSYSLDDSCFLATVTALNLLADTLYLPQHFTSSNGFRKTCRKIVLVDGGRRSWTLDLRVDERSDTFYISQGWRNFCDDNGQKAGGVFTFKLLGNGETPVLSFHPTESADITSDCSQACERESLSTEKKEESSEDERRVLESLREIAKNSRIRSSPYSFYSPSHKRFVTFTLPDDYVRIRLTLPVPFVRENGIDKFGEIYLLGKDGKKYLSQLLLDGQGTMRLGKGWKEFVKANGLEPSLTFKLIWEDTSPVLRLCCAESNNDRERGEYLQEKQYPFVDPRNKEKMSQDENNEEEARPLEREKNHLRTDVGDEEELPRKKKVKKNSHETSSDSSSLGNSCFVASVTALSLLTDTLHLPQNFTSSNGLTRKCRKIVIMDGGVRSWVLALKLDESSDTFYISQGWRNFCDENSQKEGGLFLFKLVGHGETPVLSFYPTKSTGNRSQRDSSEASGRESLSTELGKEEDDMEGESNVDDYSKFEPLTEIEKMKYSPKRRTSRYSSYSPSHKLFVTFTLPPYYARISALCLPVPFVKDNGINKPGEIYLMGKDGTKWLTSLRLDKKGTMSLGKGWKEFVKANGLESCFTVKLIWEDTTPVLSLCCPESTSDRELEEYLKAIEKPSLFIDPSNGEKISKDENNEDERSREREKNHLSCRDSTPLCQKEFVTLTITPYSVKRSRLCLPRKFTTENGISTPRTISLLGKDGIKHGTILRFHKENRVMCLGTGWKEFVKVNGLSTGDSFTLKLIWEDTTPVLSLCYAESTTDREQGENINEDEKSKEERKSWETPILNFCTTESINNRSQREFSEPSGGESLFTNHSSKEGDIEGESDEEDCIILESSFCAESTSDREQEEYLKRIEEQSHFVDPSNGDNISEDEDNEDERSWEWDGSHPSQKEFVTLTITPYSVKKSTLRLPKKFTRENNINMPGMIILLGKDGVKQLTSLLCEKNRTMYLGKGWKDFVKENGLTTGDSFTLKLTWEDTTPVLSLCCEESTSDRGQEELPKAIDNRSQREVSEASGRESLSAELSIKEGDIEGESNEEDCMIFDSKSCAESTIDREQEEYLKRIEKQSHFEDPSNGDNISKDADNEDGRSWEGESTSYRAEDELPKAIEKQSISIDSSSRDEISKDENNKGEIMSCERDSTPSSQNQSVTIILTSYIVEKSILYLSRKFTTENGINEPGMITLLGKDGMKQQARLLTNKGSMVLGRGWKSFVKANALKAGDSIMLELIWEDTTPVLKIDGGEGGGCSGINEKKSIPGEASEDSTEENNNETDNNNIEENSKEESRLWGREKDHLRLEMLIWATRTHLGPTHLTSVPI